MDYYDNTTTYNNALDRIEETQNLYFDKAKNTFKVLYAIGLIVLVGAIVSMYLVAKPFVYFLFPILFIPVTLLFITVFIRNMYKNKIINIVINDEIVRLYNMKNNTHLEYQYRPKITKEFNTSMGLFTKYASVRTKYRITGNSLENTSFEMMNCSLITSNGKSSTVHFDGIYIRLFIPGFPRQQIRSKGRDHMSGIKMKREEQYEERVYIPEAIQNGFVDTHLLGLFRNLENEFEVSNYYVSSNEKEVHIAFSPTIKNKLPELFNYETFQVYAEPLMNYISFVFESIQKLEGLL